MSEQPVRREPRQRPRSAPRPTHVRLARIVRRLWDPVRGLYRSLRLLRRGRKGVERAPRWPRGRMASLFVRGVVLLGGLALLVAAGRAAYIAVRGNDAEGPWGFNPDGACRDIGYSCGVASSILMTLLTLAFTGALFLVVRMRNVRRPYIHSARRETKDLVQTAGTIIGDVVGRDEVCHVIMDDLRVSDSRRPHVVVGGVGVGKTAVLFRLTRLLADHGAVPVPIRLRDAQVSLDFATLARDRFVAEVATSSLSSAEAERVWRRLLKDDKIVVLADGLEEALSGNGRGDAAAAGDAEERDNKVRVAIRAAHRQKLPLVIAARPHEALTGLDAAVVELEPLGEEAALEYLETGAATRDEHRLDWVIETAEVTETPFYLQIAHELNDEGLLGYAQPRSQESRLDTRGMDRAALRVALLRTWTASLIDGHFQPQLPMKRELRAATVSQLSALACMGLKTDSLDVAFDELLAKGPDDNVRYSRLLNGLRQEIGKVLKADNPKLQPEKFKLEREISLAATRGIQLSLVQPIGNGVRFPHSIMQAYLASRVIGQVIAEDPSYLDEALEKPCRELLLALVMYSRRPLGIDSDLSQLSTIRDRLLGNDGNAGKEQHNKRKLGKLEIDEQLDVLVSALEIDAVAPAPEHADIAAALDAAWPPASENRTVEDAKMRAIGRLGASLRAIAERARKGEHVQPAYEHLHAIALKDVAYRVRLAAAQELGTGGDRAIAALARWEPEHGDRPGPHEPPSSDRLAARREALSRNLGPPEGDEWKIEDTHRGFVIRAWLAPLLFGSAEQHDAEARANLASWVKRVAPPLDRDPLPVSLEVALAQGFKHAANRRPQHPDAQEEARGYLAERAAEMLEDARFWYSRLTLVHALCLWALPDTEQAAAHAAKRVRRAMARPSAARRAPRANDEPRSRAVDPGALVGHWLESRVPEKEHAFVAEARELAVLALEKRQPEKFLWIDESGVATKIGARPPRSDVVRRHNLWIPPSAGWSALHPRAQQLVADVLLLLNLVERGADPEERETRLRRATREDLPACLKGERTYLEPTRTIGMARNLAPGASCKGGCHFDLCPYPPKGAQAYRVELSEAFCRRQQVLLGPRWRVGPRRTARWQGALPRDLRMFWADMEERARR